MPNDPRSGKLWAFGLPIDPGNRIAHKDDLSGVGMSITVIVFSVALSRHLRNVGFGSKREVKSMGSRQIEI